MAGNLDRDFGYLMPFLDKVAAAAGSADPKVRSELSSLVAGEKARWQRIQALLSGAAAPNADLTPAPSRRSARPGAEPASRETPVTGFTVGSLREG